MQITRKQLDKMIEHKVAKVLKESYDDEVMNNDAFEAAEGQLISDIIKACGGRYDRNSAYDIKLMIDDFYQTWGDFISEID